MNQLDLLKRFSTICVDGARFRGFRAHAPRDAIVDPARLLEAAQDPEYAPMFAAVAAACRARSDDRMVDELCVRFGVEVLKVVPGRLLCEVDARLAFDAGATIARALRLVELYERAGVDRERLLVTTCGNWEGIQAAKALQHQGVDCNVGLVFALPQAVAGAEAGAARVTPQVGRVDVWHARHGAAAMRAGAADGAPAAPAAGGVAIAGAAVAGVDAGVQMVRQVYTYFRKFGIGTEVMAADLRDAAQAVALAGCDALAVEPGLLATLQSGAEPIARRLDPAEAAASPIHAITLNEASFRTAINDDPMATEMLAAGIRASAAAAHRLQALLRSQP